MMVIILLSVLIAVGLTFYIKREVASIANKEKELEEQLTSTLEGNN